MTSGRTFIISFLLFFCASVSVAQKSPSSESDLKKQAEKLFEKESYTDAATMYSQLLSLYPREAIYNYRYGVCLLLSGQDKTGAASYLEVAAKSKETDPDVNFYLGRSYMFMDHYNEAINAFTLFKKTGSTAKQTKLQPELYIQNCENANQLRKDRKNVVVLNKSKVNRATFFASYDFTNAAGKLLTTPDRFLTPMDKEKMNNPVMFMTKDGETIYYASYGKKGEHGKDIYRIVKLQGGLWSEPVNLGIPINTGANEDFPYLDKDGRTLYFSSIGHNSIGGYDVFKSQYDFNTGKWSDPVNVGIPVNTVDDDIFYMPSTKGETATYSTAVECETGRIELRNIKLGDVVNNVAVISGKYFSQDQVTRRDARITVIRTKDNGVVTSVKTDRLGDYELILPTGDDYMLIVEGGSYIPHAENFSLPEGFSVNGLKQRVSMNKAGDVEEMTMSNYFTPSASDASTATIEKPTQVVKSEFDVKDTASRKMQPITFEGKTLFVAPPSLKNYGGPDVDPSAFAANEKEPQTPANVTSGTDSVPMQEAESDEEITGTGTEVMNENIVADEKKPEPVVSDKTSNAELVKMAFVEAEAIKEEAVSLHEDAVEKMAESKTLDSLSKTQVKEANQLLANGDKEQSQQVFSESQQNALDALQKNKEAQNIEADAGVKDVESKKAFEEATQFMKEFKVDTNALAYQSISGKESVKTAERTRNNAKGEKQESMQSAGNQNSDASPTHTEKAAKLAEEAANLVLASLEMEKKAEKATDKTEKIKYENKAKDLKQQSELKKAAAATESQLAVKANEQPLAVNSNNDKVADATSTSSATPIEKKGPQTNSKDKPSGAEVQNDLSNKEVTEDSKTGNTIVENQPGTSNKQNNAQEENKVAPGEKDEAIQPIAGKESTTENETSDSGNDKVNQGQAQKPEQVQQKNDETTALNEKNTSDNSSKNIVEENKVPAEVNDKTTKTGNVNQPQQENVEPAAKNEKSASGNAEEVAINEKSNSEKASSKTEAEAGIKNSGNTTATTITGVKSTPPVEVKIDPVAVTHYQNYQERLVESKRTEAASKETEAKLLTNNTSEKRDSIAAKSAELNKQSIMQWQQAQKELSLAKEIDPEIEEKAQSISAAGVTAMNETGKSNTETSIVSKPVTENKKAEVDMGSPKQENNNSTPEAIAEVLDTTKPEYPKYVETQKEILQKQTETVDLFVQGMQLNKKAVAIRADEMKLRDQAEVSTKKKEKARLIEQADSLAMEAEIVTNHSKEMLAVAQKNTGTVKALTLKSNELKAALVVPAKPEQNEQAIAANTESQKEKSNISTSKENPGTRNSTTETTRAQQPAQPVDGVSSESTSNNTSAENKTETAPSSGVVNDNAAPASTENTGTTTGRKNAASGSGSQETTGQKVNEQDSDSPPGNIQPSVTPDPSTASSQDEKVKELTVSNQMPAQKDNSEIADPGSDLKLETTITDEATFSMAKGDAYSASNPIPIDPVLPEGLVFKVQIGAFHKPLPDNTFKNLQPLSGETTRPGWIRYCLGLFKTFEPANLLKKEVRSMGYKDAFVVAYFNGKRIPLYDAYAMISKANAPQKKTYAAISEKEFNHLAKFEIVKSNFSNKPDDDTKAFYGTVERVSPELVEYAVQVGVYKTSNTRAALSSLLPLNTEQMKSGLYRFTTGRFNNRAAADSMKRVAVRAGVTDAFVVIYKGGKKAGEAEAQRIISGLKTTPSPVASNTASSAGTVNPTSQPVSTPAQSSPVSPDDVVFKIQLGAFKENVPLNTLTSFLSIADKGISQETDARGLHIFYAGQFKNYNESVAARDEIVSKGVKDAFIVAFVKGRRTTATEALRLLNLK